MELFLVDEGQYIDIQHPIHIHGYSPYIIAIERHADTPEKNFGPPEFPRNWRGFPRKYFQHVI